MWGGDRRLLSWFAAMIPGRSPGPRKRAHYDVLPLSLKVGPNHNHASETSITVFIVSTGSYTDTCSRGCSFLIVIPAFSAASSVV